jgi:hypothetical protein
MKPYVKALHGRLFNQPITAPYKTTLKLVSYYIADERVIIRVQQEINGITIDRSEIIALFERSELKYIKGNIFISEEVSELEADSLDVINLLFKIEKMMYALFPRRIFLSIFRRISLRGFAKRNKRLQEGKEA